MGGLSGGGAMAGTITPSDAAAALPEAIDTLKRIAREQADPDDLSGQEVVSLLNLAWVAATRWRIEQELDLEERD
jgi:hypothetical protein